MLPRVKINFLNGQLGTVGESADGLMAIVCGGTQTTADLPHNLRPFVLNTVYEFTSADDLMAYNLGDNTNIGVRTAVSEFYRQAGNGARLILYPVTNSRTMSFICDIANKAPGTLYDLIMKTNGRLRGIGICNVNSGNTEMEDGMLKDVYDALPKAQAAAEFATDELYGPLFVALEGEGFTTDPEEDDVRDLTTENYNRVAVTLGSIHESGPGETAVARLLGRVASIPVQRNIGRVKDGPLVVPSTLYLDRDLVEENTSLVAQLNDKGYIVPRKHVGRTGYFFADDPLACVKTDDYSSLANRRVIDKAYRIAYDTMLEELLDELELNEDGTLQYGVVKGWQQMLENAINRQMTALGELSATDGEGCKCFIDASQNVVATSRIELTLKVRPYGYARFIDVNLGFQVTTA